MNRRPSAAVVTGLIALCLAHGAVAGPIEDARAAVAAHPDDPEGYEALGRLQQKAGDNDGAIATWRALIAAVPAYDRGRYRLALALRKADRLPEAAAAYREYIERAPADPDARFGLAKTLEQLGDRTEALEAYRAYVRLEQRPSEADWVARARESIAALEATAGAGSGAAPADAVASPVVGAPVAADAAQPDASRGASIPTLATSPGASAPVASPGPPLSTPAASPGGADATAAAPALPGADSAAAPDLLADGDRAAAAPATRETPLLADTLVARTAPAADADAAFATGQYAPAAAAYVAALAARPDDPGLHYRAAVAAALAGDPITAEHHAGLALRLDPGNPPAADLARAAHAHRLRAEAPPSPAVAAVDRALRDGRLRTAARLADAALAAGPSPAARGALLRLRGRALLVLGRFDEAFAALKAAAASNPPSADLWGELAVAAAGRGDREAADALRRIAARVADPAHPLAENRPAAHAEDPR